MIEHLAGGNILLIIAIKLAIIVAIFLPIVSVNSLFCIWWERKIAGHMQSRVGPMHVGLWHGWAQTIADGMKLLLKEDLVPASADRLMFRLAPYLAFAPVFAAFLALPFSPQFVFESGLNIGVLYLLAVLSVEVLGTLLAGWGSNSKWALYGAMREACQMVSYEIPLGISIIVGVLVAGTLNLSELGYLQAGGVHTWLAFHNPFIMIAVLIYFVASLASNKRAPFDLPEAESELVAGFLTEYSGLRWSFFFMAEYSAMLVVGCIMAALFLGGWNSPFGPWDPVYLATGYDPVAAATAHFDGSLPTAVTWPDKAALLGVSSVGLIAVNLWAAAWFIGKAVAIIFVQMWLRWTLPRIRMDQVLYACVNVLLPASLVMLAGTAVWIVLVPQPEPVLLGAGRTVSYLGHLIGPTPPVQMVTQIVLSAIGVLGLLAIAGFVAVTWLQRHKNMHQSLFADAMPVGRDVTFQVATATPAAPTAGH